MSSTKINLKSMYQNKVNDIYKGQFDGFLDFLRFSGRGNIHNFSIYNRILLYSQKPKATVVNTFAAWKEKESRFPRSHTGLYLDSGKFDGKVMCLFDYSDTIPSTKTASFNRPWHFTQPAYDYLVERTKGENFEECIKNLTRTYVRGIMLPRKWVDKFGREECERFILECSMVTIMTRCNRTYSPSKDVLDMYSSIDVKDYGIFFGEIGASITEISHGTINQISQFMMRYLKEERENKERGNSYGERNNDRGRVSEGSESSRGRDKKEFGYYRNDVNDVGNERNDHSEGGQVRNISDGLHGRELSTENTVADVTGSDASIRTSSDAGVQEQNVSARGSVSERENTQNGTELHGERTVEEQSTQLRRGNSDERSTVRESSLESDTVADDDNELFDALFDTENPRTKEIKSEEAEEQVEGLLDDFEESPELEELESNVPMVHALNQNEISEDFIQAAMMSQVHPFIHREIYDGFVATENKEDRISLLQKRFGISDYKVLLADEVYARFDMSCDTNTDGMHLRWTKDEESYATDYTWSDVEEQFQKQIDSGIFSKAYIPYREGLDDSLWKDPLKNVVEHLCDWEKSLLYWTVKIGRPDDVRNFIESVFASRQEVLRLYHPNNASGSCLLNEKLPEHPSILELVYPDSEMDVLFVKNVYSSEIYDLLKEMVWGQELTAQLSLEEIVKEHSKDSIFQEAISVLRKSSIALPWEDALNHFLKETLFAGNLGVFTNEIFSADISFQKKAQWVSDCFSIERSHYSQLKIEYTAEDGSALDGKICSTSTSGVQVVYTDLEGYITAENFDWKTCAAQIDKMVKSKDFVQSNVLAYFHDKPEEFVSPDWVMDLYHIYKDDISGHGEDAILLNECDNMILDKITDQDFFSSFHRDIDVIFNLSLPEELKKQYTQELCRNLSPL